MPGRAVWIQENTSRSHATLAFAGCHWRCLGRLAPFQGEGEGEGEGLISSRWQLVLTLTPHLHPLPFVRGEAIRPPGRRRACPTTRFDRVLVASPNYCYVALSPRRAGSGRGLLLNFPALKLGRYSLAATSRLYLLFWKSLSSIPAFLIHSAFGRMFVIARLQACRLEFRRRICAQYLPATGCSRAMPDSSAHNQRAFQNRDSSGA